MTDDVELLNLPDELILAIMKKVNPQVLFLCAMVDIGNKRLQQLAFDRCYSLDLTFDYLQAPYGSLMNQFYSHVMPRIIHNIQTLTINLHHVSSMQNFVENNCNGTLPNLTHLKILLGVNTGMPHTIDIYHMDCHKLRKPLHTIEPQQFLVTDFSWGANVATLCRSSFMCSVQSLEFDDHCVLAPNIVDNQLSSDQVTKLTHIRVNLYGFYQCINLLNQLGAQLHSLTVAIECISGHEPNLISKMRSISCPNFKKMKIAIYRNVNNYELCISLLQRLSNVEYLTLLLAITKNSTIPNHFIDGSVLERSIVAYMPRLHQFNFHIRSILKNASHITIDQIRQSFQKQQQQPFDCVLDHFKNNYGQCQIYSLPFIGTRLDFVSNRFPLFDINNTFSNVTTLLLFDDVKPFESIFFERLARALPQLKTLEIINQLEQQEKTTSTETNIDFAQLAVLILYDIHMDYAEQFLYKIHLPYQIELAINKDILLTIITQKRQQAGDNCSKVARLLTSEPSYELINTIRNFFPLAQYVKHKKEWKK